MKDNHFIKETNCSENKRSKKVAIVILIIGLLLGLILITMGIIQSFRVEEASNLIDYYMYGCLAIIATIFIAGDIYMTPKSWLMVNNFYKKCKKPAD